MRNFYKFTCILLFTVCAKAQVPMATILSNSTIFCTSNTFTFSAASADPGLSYSWVVTPSKTVTFTTVNSGSDISFRVGNAGTYSISLTIANSATSAVVSKAFNVTASPKAAFNASLSKQGFPTQLVLTGYSLNSTKNYWIFDGNTSEKDSSVTLVKTYTASGSYNVILVAKGNSGCTDTSRYSFRIADSSGVTLPNIFSPNNDGINDVFKPVAKGMLTLSAWIYNRNGIIISSWENRVNGFWDGYTTSGEPCIAGEYFVVVEATGFDGKKYKLKGSITLLR